MNEKLNERIAEIVMEGVKVMERRDSNLKQEIKEVIMKEDIAVSTLLDNVLNYCFNNFYGYPNGGAEEMLKGVIPKSTLKEVLELIGGIK